LQSKGVFGTILNYMGIFSGKTDNLVKDLFSVGAHFGYSKSRRHPSARSVIFGAKNKLELIDLEETAKYIERVKEFAEGLGKAGKMILFVSGKTEARKAIKEVANRIGMPYVAGRWVGGTLTNFDEIRSRVNKLVSLREQKEKGELSKYTKKERLMIDREIERLEAMYNGIVCMDSKPHALFVVDTNAEKSAVREAKRLSLPIMSISGTDCDLTIPEYPIPANDKNGETIAYILGIIVDAYEEGLKDAPQKVSKKEN